MATATTVMQKSGRKNCFLWWNVVALALVAVVLSLSGHAAVMLTDDGTALLRDDDDTTLGGVFSVTSDAALPRLRVTALGIWDDDASDVVNWPGGTPGETGGTPDGLAESHQIGIWNADGTALLASVTATAGTGGTLVGEFRYFDLAAPIKLHGGETYVIGAHYTAGTLDLWHTRETVTTGPRVNLLGHAFSRSAGFRYPEANSTTNAEMYIGPSFQYIEVPEPASLMLLVAGAGIFLRRQCGRNAEI